MRRASTLVLLLAVLAVVTAGPAAAHGDEGVLEVIEQTPSDDGSSVTYLVALTYTDGDGADDAVVTATAIGGGTPQAPITFTSTGAGGGYQGTVTYPTPGPWTVRFASADPEARVEATYRAPAPSTTVTTVVPSTVVPPTSVAEEPTLIDEDDDDGPPPWGLVIGPVLAVALLAGTIVLVRRRRTDTT